MSFEGHRPKELIVLAGLLGDDNRDAGHHLPQVLGFGPILGFLAQMRLPLLLDDLLVRVSRRHSQPLGQQKIARVTGGHIHHLAARSQFVDIFSQYDVHDSSGLDHSRERQQRDVAGFLDCVGQPPLAGSADARDPPRHDLAALGDKRVQHLDVFVVDVVDLLDAEAAYFLAPEILLLPREPRFVAAGGRCPALPGLPLDSAMMFT